MIKVRQIYYQESQKNDLIFEGIYNPVTDNYRYLAFESEVIVNQVKSNQHIDYKYFGVLSVGFRDKIKDAMRWGKDIANQSKEFNIDRFLIMCEKSNFDVVSLATHPKHSVYKLAEKYHPGIFNLTKDILNEIGFNYDIARIQHQPIYFNYFVASPKVLSLFVNELLDPAIEVMTTKYLDRCLMNSNYPKVFPSHLQHFGISHYPFIPFIAERLISLYIDAKKLRVKNYA